MAGSGANSPMGRPFLEWTAHSSPVSRNSERGKEESSSSALTNSHPVLSAVPATEMLQSYICIQASCCIRRL